MVCCVWNLYHQTIYVRMQNFGSGFGVCGGRGEGYRNGLYIGKMYCQNLYSNIGPLNYTAASGTAKCREIIYVNSSNAKATEYSPKYVRRINGRSYRSKNIFIFSTSMRICVVCLSHCETVCLRFEWFLYSECDLYRTVYGFR